jgi:hypothetical protein
LNISVDGTFVDSIRDGYKSDPWCAKFTSITPSFPGLINENGLWYIGSRMIIPRAGTIRENLYRLTHDSLGHFGFDKSYKSLRDAYYWPNMRRDLERAYIPGCPECQTNKSRTTPKAGPLHPLPIPDEHCDSVAIDFIGPLPEDQGFNCIVTMTDRSGSDVQIVPTQTDISAEDFALLFFDKWYCENGCPLEIISDRDKLFVSAFWKALHKLTGVKLKLSTAYHPETDGSSEHTNKTVNQCIRYHVSRNQTGWVRALPRVRFHIMNTVNASTGYSPFQLRTGRSPHLIPPFAPAAPVSKVPTDVLAANIIKCLETDFQDAQDNLLAAKFTQAKQANKTRGPDPDYKVGERVKLSTANRRGAYVRGGEKGQLHVAKYMPRFDGPFTIKAVHKECSTATLDMASQPHVFPVFHTSEIEPYVENNDELFPSRKLERPGPIITDLGEEHEVADIIDQRKRGRGYQYLVRWAGHGNEDACWLPGREVAHLNALRDWLNSKAAQSDPIASIAHIDALRDWLDSLEDDEAPAGDPFIFYLQSESLPIAARP